MVHTYRCHSSRKTCIGLICDIIGRGERGVSNLEVYEVHVLQPSKVKNHVFWLRISNYTHDMIEKPLLVLHEKLNLLG